MKLKTETENGFKQTEIGSIPEDWETAKINEAYSFTKKPPRIDLSKYKRIPFIPMEFVPDDGKDLNRYKFREKVSSGTFVCKGDLIVAKITPSFENGKQAIVRDIPFDFVYATTEVWPIHEIEGQSDIDYLFYYLKKPDVRNDVAGKMEGSTGRQRVPKNVLENLTIPFPTLKEQQKIASVLSKIQQTIAQQEQIIGKTKELKRSLMHRLFTDGLRGEELKETEIGLMPESWSARRLKDVVEKTSQRDMTKTPDIQFKYIDVSSISNESLKIIGSTTYKGSEAPSRARKVVKVNDVLFATVRPTLKRIAYAGNEFDGEVCSTAFCVLRSVSTLSSRYLYYCVQRDSFIESLGKLQRGASYPAVTDGNVKDQLIPFPMLDEQGEIANTLWDIDNKINHETVKNNVLKDLFKSMLQLLMTGEVRVKDIDFGEACE